MNKIIKLTIGIIILIPIIYLSIFFMQNYLIKNSIKEYTYSYKYNVKNVKNRGAIRCNWNIFEPEFTEVELENRRGRDIYYISFWKGNMFFKLTQENWENHKVGATTVKNTAFPRLLAMVKEDCYQFQKGYDNPDKNGIDWGYREYKEIEPYTPPKKIDDIHMLNEDGSIRVEENNEDILPII